MDIFNKAFGRERKPNEKQRNWSDLFKVKFDYVAYFLVATEQYLKADYQQALSSINTTIEKADINDSNHYAFRANVYEDLKNYKLAILDYERAIELNTNDVAVYALYHQIGFCYLTLGNNPKAIEFYTYAIELKKQYPNTLKTQDLEGMDGGVMRGVPLKRMYNNRANAFNNDNKLIEAVADCEQALSYDAKYANPYLLLSQIFSRVGQNEEALTYLKTSAQLGNQTAIILLKNSSISF